MRRALIITLPPCGKSVPLVIDVLVFKNLTPHGDRAQTNLGQGWVVTGRGTLNAEALSGVAANIQYVSNIRGIVEEINLDEGTIRVLRQTIRVPADVIFRNVGSLAELKLDDLVEISGYTGAESLVATYLELRGPFVPGTTKLSLRGTVGNIDGLKFNIGKLDIDFSNVQQAGALLSSGDEVEVISDALPQNGVLIATQLLPIKPRLGVATGDQISIAGLVSQFESASAFTVSGIPITTNSQTVFENGGAANLATDSKVIVRGQLDGDVLIASKIVFR